MGHSITAIILKGDFDADRAEKFDLFANRLGFGLTLFHIDHYYSARWQHQLKTIGQLEISNIECEIFPHERAIFEIIKNISASKDPEYAIILTDYFGGRGKQYANVFTNANNANNSISTINQALIHLGVKAISGLDEFDTVGLGKFRNQPDYLEKYVELSGTFGV